MQIYIKTLFIIHLFALATCFEDASDINRMSLYLREGDNLRVDLRKMMSFYSTSINFSSNNKYVGLPGIPNKDPKKFLEDMPLNPVIFKNKEGHIFFVNEDRVKIHFYRLNQELNLEQIDLEFNTLLKNNPSFRVADIHIDEKYMAILYYDNNNQNAQSEKSKYSIYRFNYLELDEDAEAEFEISKCAKPTLKQFSPSKDKTGTIKLYMVFDKELNAVDNFSVNKHFNVIKIDFTSPKSVVDPSDVRQFLINPILFSASARNEGLKVKNIMISSSLGHQLFFFVQSQKKANTNQNAVYSCDIDYSQKIQEIGIRNCKEFIKDPVKQFFLKGTKYIYINTNNQMIFSNMEGNYHKAGTIQEDWQLKNVLMEENYAVITMSINNAKFVFVNDFKENTLTWFFDNKNPILTSFIVYGFVDQKQHVFLAEIQEAPLMGFSLRDVTLNPFFTIVANDIQENQSINLYLDEKTILSYDLHKKSNRPVEEITKDKQLEVLMVPPNNIYRTKLHFAGSDMRFTDLGAAKVKYFNEMKMEILLNEEDSKIKGQYYHFFQNWMFFKNVIFELTCTSLKEGDITYRCVEANKIILENEINPKKIKGVERLGDFLVLKADSSNDFVFFNSATQQILNFNYPETFKNGKKCMVFQYYVACIYETSTRVPEIAVQEVVRVFTIQANGLNDLAWFETDLKKSMDSYLKEDEVKKGLVRISIIAFDFDNVQTQKLSILYALNYGGSFVTAYMNYNFNQNPNNEAGQSLTLLGHNTNFETNGEIKHQTNMIVLDSQTIFFNFEPTFKMFCYDEDSEYVFESIDMRNVLQTILINTHSIVIFIYEDAQEKHFFAVFKITQNAVKQLIRVQQIPDYDENYVLSVIPIDEMTLGFYQYNPVSSNKGYENFMYFRNGPVLVHNDPSVSINVNNNHFRMEFKEDKYFNQNIIKMKETNRIVIDELQTRLSLKVNNFFGFEGNMRDIELTGDAKTLSGIKFIKPLTFFAERIQTSVEEGTNPTGLKITSSEAWYVFQVDNSGVKFNLVDKSSSQVKTTIAFNLKHGQKCTDVLISQLSLLCFWTDGVFPIVSLMTIADPTRPQEDIYLPEEMHNPNILADNHDSLVIIYRDVYGKYICVMTYTRHSKIASSKFIGKKEMSVDDLNILDYFHDITGLKTLTVIFLDAHSNQVLFYHGLLKEETSIPILKRSVSLNDLDMAVEKLQCQPLKENSKHNYHYNCLLFSASYIYYAKIRKVDRNESIKKNPNNIDVSEFKWELAVRKKFYNILCGTAAENKFNAESIFNDNSVFIYQKDINNATPVKEIVYFDLNIKNNKYSSFAYNLDAYNDILKIDFISNTEIGVFFVKEGVIKTARLTIGEYALEIQDQNTLDKKTIDFNAVFTGETHQFKFTFGYKEVAPENLLQNKNVWMACLIAGIVIVSVLILLAGVYLVVLLRQKKKLLMAIDSNAMDQTDVDISYM